MNLLAQTMGNDETRTTNFCFCFKILIFSFSSFDKTVAFISFFLASLQFYNQLTYAACAILASSQYVFCMSLFQVYAHLFTQYTYHC